MTLEDWQQRDVEALAELHTQRDPRTISEMIADDPSYDVRVEKADYDGDGTSVTFADNMGTYLKGPEVKAGDTVTFYNGSRMSLLAAPRHGWALNDQVIEWKTEWERFAERIAMLAAHDRSRREHYEQARADLADWYAQLTGPYRARIDRFRAQDADFDVQSGTYETYPVLMAQRIERWCRRHDTTVEAFRDLGQDAQSRVLHAGKPDTYGISGHQFDSACGLAAAVMDGATI